MKKIIILTGGLMIQSICLVGQNVGIGTTAPVTVLNLIGPGESPTIPGITSTGIFRIGVSPNDGIDMGKMIDSTFAGWIQAGYNSNISDPLSLQPAGGNVGIGTINPSNKLSVVGNTNITGNVGIGINNPSNKLSVVGNANVTGTAAIGTNSPNASAQLEVSSGSKGFLPPRMTFSQRNAISSPVAGLMIWCTNCGIQGQVQVHNGTSWTNMTGTPAVGFPTIGTLDGGGVIAYIFLPGDPGYVAGQVHGLITTLPDQQIIGIQYGCNGTNIPGAEGTILGTGYQNTVDVVSGCGSAGIAAKACNDLITGGFTDWYLPSKDELNKLYLNRVAIGGFFESWYWSSSEFSSSQAWGHHFNTSSGLAVAKDFDFTVRAIRSF